MRLKKIKPIRIAIDATAGSGSTSLALKLAKHYRLRYCDTGKVYRWCALQIIKKKPKNKIKFLKKRIKSLNLKQLLKVEGILATCIQHEMDHLEGILFIDYLSKLKKSMIVKKLSKLKKSSVERIVV